MVACSIWSPQKGINNPQRCTEKINGRTFPAYNIVDSTTSNLDIRLIHSPLIHAEILVNWVLHIHFLRVQMTPKHPLPWGCWVYDVVTSTMFGVPTFWTSIIPSQIIWLDKASCLLASTERNNENRALVCSIWSLQKGINNLQRCREKINGRTIPFYDVVDSTTSNLDMRFIHSSLFHTAILLKWFLCIHFLGVEMTPKHPLPWGC
jgi:hypothetical protein